MKKSFMLSCILLTGCLPGSEGAGAPPSISAPADEVFMNLFRSVEERRADRFAAAVDPNSNPPREQLWDELNTFHGIAEDIEYNVSVERRIAQGDKTIYVFTWRRKHRDRDSGLNIDEQGRTEWTLSRASGRYLLVQSTGTAIF